MNLKSQILTSSQFKTQNSKLKTPDRTPGRPVPPRKFLLFIHQPDDRHPYGRPLCARAYWYYWFKKNNLKFWVIYNEKFGSPTAVAKYSPGTPPEERDRLLQVLENLQSDTGVTLPENITLEFLEARRSGTINTYRELADWCNDEISKLVLGQTLTTSEGRRSGSLALGRVHEAVRNDTVEADARALMEVINSQLLPWLTSLNYPAGTPVPQFVADTARDEDLPAEIELDRQLVSMGLPLSSNYFYEKYGRPAPDPDQRQLRFDDQNLYQYHLQFGVLTINEVRSSLGLPPVAWGDQPTRPFKDVTTPTRPRRSSSSSSPSTEIKEDLDELAPEKVKES